jgi:hypothetical protein
MMKIADFLTKFQKVVEAIESARRESMEEDSTRRELMVWPTLSSILTKYITTSAIVPENMAAYQRVMREPGAPSVYILDSQMQEIERLFDNIKSLIIDIQGLKSNFAHDTYLNEIQKMLEAANKSEDEIRVLYLKQHEIELNTLREHFDKQSDQSTLPGIPNCFSFAECSLFRDVLSINPASMILTGNMTDDFVKQWHTLNIFSPIIRKGGLHGFLLDSELGTDMRRLLLSDKIRTVDKVFTEFSVLLRKTIRLSRTRTVVEGATLYNPLECVTYVLCKEINKGIGEIELLKGKLAETETDLRNLHEKLSRPPPPPESGEPVSPGPSSPATPQVEDISPFSPSPSPPSSPPSSPPYPQASLSPANPSPENPSPSRTLTGGTTVIKKDGSYTEKYDFDNPSYFCLNTYFLQSDFYLRSYVSHDDIMELQHAVNLIFYICDVNIKDYVDTNLKTEFENLINRFTKFHRRQNFYGSKMLVYTSIKKVLIQMLTKIIFNYGVKECDNRIEEIYQEDLRLEGKSHIIEYVKSNDFISEINQRIVKVDATDTEIWTIIGDNLIDKSTTVKPTIYATHDIITEEYLLDNTSTTFFIDHYDDIAFEVCRAGEISDAIEEKQRPKRGNALADKYDEDISAPTKLKRVEQDAEFYITKCMLLRKKLQRTTQNTDIKAKAMKVMHCINLVRDRIITNPSRDIKAYYNIVKYCHDHKLIHNPTMPAMPAMLQGQGGSKPKSNKIVKFRLQDYHKKYYPLYYQTYYGNGNE